MTNASISVCPIFQGFTVEEYEELLSLLVQQSYSEGDVILHEGESQRALWILVKGGCEVVKLDKRNDERRLARLETGAVFGEMSFFHKAPHSATVRAVTPVKVMQLSRESYEKLQSICPSAACKVMQAVLSVMAQRLRRLDEWVCEFVERPEASDHRDEWHDFRAKLYADWQF